MNNCCTTSKKTFDPCDLGLSKVINGKREVFRKMCFEIPVAKSPWEILLLTVLHLTS